MEALVKDPVCGMQIEPHMYVIEYLQSRYAFCSTQCRDRFLANPHLFIGFPGQKAPKQEGLEVLKQRRLHVVRFLSSSQADSLIEALQAMMGIKSVKVDGDKIEITYDLLQVTAEQIETKMAEIGVQLGEGWTEQLCRAFVHYAEELEVGSLEVHNEKNFHQH
ncbi:MAG: YHS domain-containing protein [Methylotenera sp.]|nr:YHS domain-containing protein [Methylotenera sp.]